MKARSKATGMGKFARYSEGSEDGVKASDATYGEDERPAATGMAETTKLAPAKTDFKSAFASARSAGAKTFEWNGKKYTTETASSKPASRAASAGENQSAAETTRTFDAARAKKNSLAFGPDSAQYEQYRKRQIATDQARNNPTPPNQSAAETRRLSPSSKQISPVSMPRAAKEFGADRARSVQKLADGGVVQRSSVKSHGKAC
jgi:hypothetical protein